MPVTLQWWFDVQPVFTDAVMVLIVNNRPVANSQRKGTATPSGWGGLTIANMLAINATPSQHLRVKR
jgi:hypothetical protein